jgi:DNA-binding transcriptional LysR family regulator
LLARKTTLPRVIPTLSAQTPTTTHVTFAAANSTKPSLRLLPSIQTAPNDQVSVSGTFSSAAAALGIGQPTVSRRVAELEQALGVSLFDRTTRSVALTEAGARYLDELRPALEAIDAAAEAVRGPGPLGGRLRVAASVSFAVAWLCPRLPAFLAAHPDLGLDLHLADRHVDLVAEAMDVAVRIGGPDVPTLTGRRLRVVERWYVASPEWIATHGEPLTPSDLARHTGLVFAPAGIWPRAFEGEDQVAPRRVVAATSGQALIELARAGVGVAMLPDWLVERDLERGTLVRVLRGHAGVPLPLWVVWPHRRTVGGGVRAFVEWMSAEASGAARPAGS